MRHRLHAAPPTTPAFSQAPSRHDISPVLLPLTLRASGSATATRTVQERADPGCRPRGEGWQDGSHGKEEWKSLACTLWEKVWRTWARAPILLHLPLKGLELLFSFCQRWKGNEEEQHLPHHLHRHTDTCSLISQPQRLHAHWTTPHSRTNNPSPAPPQPSLPPPSSMNTQEQWVLPHSH